MANMYMKIEECARYLGMSKWTLYQWAKKGKIPAHKFYGALRFKKDEIDTWASTKRVN
ncbi:MAG: helix-turn-helix domain-containing protein [Candidatus Omnitrophica bacterium]|nr:helix-turn-helix domain-containing protein [Candidatus Omnitrophota bacterium]